ncbi:MAG: L,D-transpeptidase [Phycisphaerae bacterium]|nr:L,D-transpeptidase [Phycisphaerae bacterium]
MSSDSPTSRPAEKGSFFRVLLAAEVAVLLGLLGVWGYRTMTRSLADESKADSSGVTKPADQTAGPPSRRAPRRQPRIKRTTPRTLPATTGTSRTAPTERVAMLNQNRPLPELRAPLILVEKSKQRLTVYDNNKAVKQYPASTGRNPGDKRREGDFRTPEGEFYVCVKNEKSKYTRALGLSYPSLDDAQRGLRDGLITRQDYDRIVQAIRHRRQPPWKTPLGGEIMIHGDRRGGRTTQGCIALEDRDILELFPRIPLGTRVMIQP